MPKKLTHDDPTQHARAKHYYLTVPALEAKAKALDEIIDWVIGNANEIESDTYYELLRILDPWLTASKFGGRPKRKK